MQRLIYLWLAAMVVTALAACTTGAPDAPPDRPREASRTASGDLRTQTVLLPGHEEPTEITFEVRQGEAIFEGDINLGEVDAEGYLVDDGLDENVSAQAVFIDHPTGDYRWPEGVIPYTISGNWDDPTTAEDEHRAMLELIQHAIAEWEDKTLIRLMPVPQTFEKGYLDFARADSANECNGDIGYQGEKKHTLKLGVGCNQLSTLVHEMGHVVGLWHEQSRADRDDYLEVRLENIIDGPEGNEDFYRDQFKPHIADGKDIGEYDYKSIMHYSKDVLAKDRFTCLGFDGEKRVPQDLAKCTMVTTQEKDPFQLHLDLMGTYEVLSDLDVAAVMEHYDILQSDLKSGDFGCEGGVRCKLGDVNGDGLDDLVQFIHNSKSGDKAGDVFVAKGTGDGFATPYKAHGLFCLGNQLCDVADVNRDGKSDLVTLTKAGSGSYTGNVYVALSNGYGFGSALLWDKDFCINGIEKCLTGDFNGDDRDDLVLIQNGAFNSDNVYVRLSNGSKFSDAGKWSDSFCGKGETCAVGDVNGDGRDDLVSFLRGPNAFGANGDVYVALSYGSGFGTKQKWHKNICYGSSSNKCLVADVNGDSKADLVAANTVGFNPSNPGDGSDVFVALSNGSAFEGSTKRHDLFMMSASDTVLSGRLNGDEKRDLITISGPNNKHKILTSYIN